MKKKSLIIIIFIFLLGLLFYLINLSQVEFKDRREEKYIIKSLENYFENYLKNEEPILNYIEAESSEYQKILPNKIISRVYSISISNNIIERYFLLKKTKNSYLCNEISDEMEYFIESFMKQNILNSGYDLTNFEIKTEIIENLDYDKNNLLDSKYSKNIILSSEDMVLVYKPVIFLYKSISQEKKDIDYYEYLYKKEGLELIEIYDGFDHVKKINYFPIGGKVSRRGRDSYY